MDQHISPFADQPIVPALVTKYIRESSLAYMEPGEITSTTPWNINLCEEHGFSILLGVSQRHVEPEGTLTVHIIRDGEKYIADLTAIEDDDLNYFGNPSHCCQIDHMNTVSFSGVLWPLLKINEGTYDPEVELFNREQIELQDQFCAYYEATYGKPYVLAGQRQLNIPDYQ